MRVNKFAAAVAATSVLLAVQAMPANAAPTTIFDDGFFVGDMFVEMRSNGLGTSHFYGWDDDNQETLGDSTTHSNGQLWFYDAVADESFYGWCDTATADETVSGNDRVVTCDEQSSEDIYTDLSIKPEVRIFPIDDNFVATVRVLYAVTNNGVADVTVDELRSVVDFDENYGVYTSNAGEGYGYADLDQSTSTNWFNLVNYSKGLDEEDPSDDSVNSVATTFGSAWQADGAEVRFVADGDMGNGDEEEFQLLATDVTFAAGETVYFAFFTVATFLPEDPTVPQIAAVNDNTVAVLQTFNDGLNDTFGAGIPAGAKVLNWSGEELADTGVESAGMFGFAATLLVAGAVVVIARRRVRA